MFKVFYDPKTFTIKGFSDGAITMEFPFVECDHAPIIMSNYKIDIIDDTPILSVIKGTFTEDEWSQILKR
jgi:hypothetical protein